MTKEQYQFTNLVDTTWLNRYPRQTENMYNQESEFIGHGFIKSPIKK